MLYILQHNPINNYAASGRLLEEVATCDQLWTACARDDLCMVFSPLNQGPINTTVAFMKPSPLGQTSASPSVVWERKPKSIFTDTDSPDQDKSL